MDQPNSLASMPADPTYYQQVVSALERARNFMGGDPTIAGSLGMMLSAIPAGRMVPPRGTIRRSFGPRDLEPPPPLEPLDIKGMNLPNVGVRRGFDAAAFNRAEDLRRQMGVQARTEGGRSTDAALNAIQEALKLAPK